MALVLLSNVLAWHFLKDGGGWTDGRNFTYTQDPEASGIPRASDCSHVSAREKIVPRCVHRVLASYKLGRPPSTVAASTTVSPVDL